MPFDPAKDFSPIVMVSYSPHVLAVIRRAGRQCEGAIAYAKANPGKLNFANSGTGGAPHLAGVEFAARTRRAVGLHPLQGRLGGGHGRESPPTQRVVQRHCSPPIRR